MAPSEAATSSGIDAKLLAAARAVKARRGAAHPVLWLFADAARMPHPERIVRRLPPGLCGLVWRNTMPGGAALIRIARLCRAHRVLLTVGERHAVPRGAGRHISATRHEPPRGCYGFVTAAAHDGAELRAVSARADLVFLSPLFPTRTHPGAAALGVVRWARLRRGVAGEVAALGGIDRSRLRAVPPGADGFGGIDMFPTY